jgi:hypothetical protein
MSNNSSTSLMAKNISSYATIGSAFLGGLVGFFIGKSMGPSEPEVEEVEESVSSMPLSNEVEESVSSSPLNVSSSSSLPLVENEVKIESEEEQVFPKLSQVEEQPLVLPTSQQVVPVSETTKEVQQAVLNPLSPEPMALEEPIPLTPTPAPSGIQGGKTKTRRSRKHHKRSSRKYIGGQAAAVIIPPSST